MSYFASATPLIVEKVLVTIKNIPERFNLPDRLLGPKDSNLQYIENKSGAQISLHGIGSGYLEPNTRREANEPLHFRITHWEPAAIQVAKPLVMHLMETVQKEFEELYQQKSSTIRQATEPFSKLQNFQRILVSQMAAGLPNRDSWNSSRTIPKPNTYNKFLDETTTSIHRNSENRCLLSEATQEYVQGQSGEEKMTKQSSCKIMYNENNTTSQQQQRPGKKRLTKAERKKAIKAKLASRGIPWDPKKFSGNKKRKHHDQSNTGFPLSFTAHKFPRDNSPLPPDSNIKDVEGNFQNVAPSLFIGGQKSSQENAPFATSSQWKFPENAFSANFSKDERDSLQQATVLRDQKYHQGDFIDSLAASSKWKTVLNTQTPPQSNPKNNSDFRDANIFLSSMGQKFPQEHFDDPPATALNAQTTLQSNPKNSSDFRNAKISLSSMGQKFPQEHFDDPPAASSQWNCPKNSPSLPHSNCKNGRSNLQNVNNSLFSRDQKNPQENVDSPQAASSYCKYTWNSLSSPCPNPKISGDSIRNTTSLLFSRDQTYPQENNLHALTSHWKSSMNMSSTSLCSPKNGINSLPYGTNSQPLNQISSQDYHEDSPLLPRHSHGKSSKQTSITSLLKRYQNYPRESLNTPLPASSWKERKWDCSLPIASNPKGKRDSSQNDILIKMAIVPLNFPDQVIQEYHVDQIEAGLLERFTPMDDGSYPSLSGSYLNKEGALILCCNNEATMAWLKSTMENFKPFGDRLRLKIVNQEEMYKCQTLLFRAPQLISDKPADHVLNLLHKQNPALRVNHWRLISAQPDPRGRCYVCSVDDTSVDLIRAADCKASLGLWQVSLNILNSKKKA